ncbi:MAG: Methyltransferase type 11 [Candidatus Curtissbacteria bacterium GW2011_GWC1_44_33]|uniref:Methyltransferase type 11 n=1 Tax=Candidatus Curtissbacteria bacterium GW2011_GWC1_44_33 TaxID=1618413 RepID=A0A0G1M796_9BACT|nr:MAG: Methyltransferase type 11 [Candidatus Curtissbacteria bacterium GW2011_GWC1_44_33]
MKIKKFHKVEKCYLCGKSQFKDLGQSKCPILTSKNHLVKCENCGLVFVNPMPDEEELSKIYSTEYRLGYQSWIGKILNFYNNAVFAAEARFIKRYIKRGKIIDIGYGSGEMLSALGPGWNKYGFDAYSKNADRIEIQRRLGIKTLASLGGLKNNSFDLVILRNDSRRLLKPGGLLFIRTPNIESLDFKMFGTNWYMTYMGGHIIFFNKRTLEKATGELGFRPLIIRPTTFSPILSLQRNLKLKFSISNKLLLFLLIPISIVYGIVSFSFRNGNDILSIFKKLKERY